MARAYYNEIDPYAAAWLRNLISAGHIAPGEVDERSIVDVRPVDLDGFTQCHFFAGIGVWSHALRFAGWSDERPVWTGSCPCQPFSAAGKGGGFADERHLWPAFFHLIAERGPAIVLGEQVASRDGLQWLDLVQDDMEGEGYAFGAVDTSSALHGAPHIRQRMRWVAYARDERRYGQPSCIWKPEASGRLSSDHVEITGRDEACRMADASAPGFSSRESAELPGALRDDEGRTTEQRRGASGWLADPYGGHAGYESVQRSREYGQQPQDGISVRCRHSGIGHNGGPELDRPGPTNGFWRDADWLFCRDGRWRPVGPGTFPLAHGSPTRVGRLRAYGNAVDAEATAAFIRAVIDVHPDAAETRDEGSQT